MHQLLYPALAAVAWAAAGYRRFALRHDAGTPARTAVTRALALLAVTFTVSTPVVWAGIDRLGVTNVAALIAHLCVVGFSITVQVMLLGWAHPPAVAQRLARRRMYFLAAVTVVLLALFIAIGPTVSHPTDFVATYAARPPFTLYLIAYLTAFGVGLVDIVRICWPYARLVGPGPLRVGLRTTAAGAMVGLLYCVARTLDVIGVAAGWDVRAWEVIIAPSASAGALLVIIGLSTPVWAPRLHAAAGSVRHLRRHRELYPLWSAMSAAVPGVRAGDRGGPGAGSRLHRRVVEIYDARLALRPYLSRSVADDARRRARAAGLCADDTAAVVEAAKIRAALTALRQGAPPADPEPADPVNESTVDEQREVEQLARVARAFARSPLVTAAADGARS